MAPHEVLSVSLNSSNVESTRAQAEEEKVSKLMESKNALSITGARLFPFNSSDMSILQAAERILGDRLHRAVYSQDKPKKKGQKESAIYVERYTWEKSNENHLSLVQQLGIDNPRGVYVIENETGDLEHIDFPSDSLGKLGLLEVEGDVVSEYGIVYVMHVDRNEFAGICDDEKRKHYWI